MEKLAKLVAALNALEDVTGVKRSDLGTFLDFGLSGRSDASESVQIKQDEFYGLEPLEAAKRFLQKRGKSASFEEIVAGIRSGGGDPGSEKRLRVSLARSTFEIAKISDDVFGLLDFYPEEKAKRTRRKPNGSVKETEAPEADPVEQVDADDGKETEEDSVQVERTDDPEDTAA